MNGSSDQWYPASFLLVLGSLLIPSAAVGGIRDWLPQSTATPAAVKPAVCPRNCKHCNANRAGRPRAIAGWAKCFPGSDYAGYYVGGSAPLRAKQATWLRGERRRFEEGTFGLDYTPFFSRVRLQWRHRD